MTVCVDRHLDSAVTQPTRNDGNAHTGPQPPGRKGVAEGMRPDVKLSVQTFPRVLPAEAPGSFVQRDKLAGVLVTANKDELVTSW